jgi:NAD(P)-dependent dehydrogenase (short-subunit alcohol dehydrogenase family)
VVAQAFAGEGATVAMADLDSHGGEETAALIRSAGAAATFVEADVGDSSQADAMVQWIRV